MPILYGAISSRNSITGECPEKEYPKLADVCKRICATVPLNENKRKTFEEDQYNFHYKSAGERVFICVATKDCPMRVCYKFLDSLEEELNREPGMKQHKLIKMRMEFHNNPENDKLGHLQKSINEVTDIMHTNMERLNERGEKIEHLVDRSNALAEASNDFRTNARAIKRAYCRRNCKLTILLIVIILVVIAIVVLIVCGAPSFKRCKDWANKAKDAAEEAGDKLDNIPIPVNITTALDFAFW